MYTLHQPVIAAYAQACPDNLARVMQFVILTVRQSLANVPGQAEIIAAGHPDADDLLYAWKARAYAEVWRDRETYYSYLIRAWINPDSDQDRAQDMIGYIATNCHGFGPVKAGFVIQLAFGLGGCLDTHNLRRFGIHPRSFDSFCNLRSAKGRNAMVRRYVAACYRRGGPEKLWNSWCEYVAARHPGRYRSAEHVSLLHCVSLGLASLEEETIA